MPGMPSRRLAAVLAAGLVLLAACGTGSSPTAARSRSQAGTTAAASACGRPGPHRVKHVIWIWFENKAYGDVVGAPAAAFTNAVARACGLATSYHGVTHPSLPNYLAATSGSTHGVQDDGPPAEHPLPGPSLFSQVAGAGRQWRSYEESMPRACALSPSGDYAVKHNPAAYYTAVRGQCARWDVALGTPSSGALAGDLRHRTLPAFAFVTPNLCHDTHDCAVSTGDAWLARWLTAITTSPAYAEGDVAVFVTWDEDDNSHGNAIPLLAVAPGIPAGTRVATPCDHACLLRTTEDLLGLPPLGAAASARSLVRALHL